MKKIGLLILLVMAPWTLMAETICAIVKIEIRQELSLERQAFDAKMVITNGLDVVSLENLDINVIFEDSDGNPVLASSDPDNTNAAFFITVDQMEGVNSIDGSGVINAGDAATINWLIIPAPGSGGSSPVGLRYAVGATVSYTYGEESQVVNVVPDYIQVRPQPKLTLDYFIPQDVFGDDPLTDQTEAIEPFDLGLRIKNSGFGDAINLKIESAQPEIIENEQGLLIDFLLLGSQVNDSEVSNSLLADIGLLPGGESAMVSWLMSTSLNGEFISFTADFVHADEFGGALTSLIDSVNTHFLAHKVLVDTAGRDQISDFLAIDGIQYRVYESNGNQADVIEQPGSLADHDVISGQQRYAFSFSNTPGPVYSQVVDPYQGNRQQFTALRSDGKVLPEQNIWQFKIQTDPGVYEYYIGLFDVDSTGSYEIIVDGAEPNVAPVISVLSPQPAEVDTLLEFDIEVTDENVGDILSLVALSAPAEASVSFVSGSTWRFAWVPEEAGTQVVVLRASDGQLNTDATINIEISEGNLDDTDQDGMSDEWELQYFGDLDETAEGDFDQDSATNLQEHDFGGDPTVEDRPTELRIIAATPAAIVPPNPLDLVTGSPDTLTVINATGAVDADLSYQFELYLNDFSGEPLAEAEVPEEQVQTSWSHGLVLEQDQRHVWRARAFDGVTPGPWDYSSFVYSDQDDAPVACSVEFPANNQTINQLRPELSVLAAQDPETQALSYRFALFSDEALTDQLAASSWLSDNGTQLQKWRPYTELSDNTSYYWQAEVTDGTHVVNCGTGSMAVNTQMELPHGYQVQHPLLNSVVDSAVIDLVIDHDETIIGSENDQYYFELDTSAAFDSVNLVQSSAVAIDGNQQARFIVQNLQDNTVYYWRAKATRVLSEGRWIYGQFVVSLSGIESHLQALNPVDFSWVDTRVPEFTMDAGLNIQGIDSYQVAIFNDTEATDLFATFNAQNKRVIAPQLNDRQMYYWSYEVLLNNGQSIQQPDLNAFFVIDDPADEMPVFEFISLVDAENTANSTYSIRWQDSDSDSDALIDLYYDTDDTGFDGTLIVAGLSENDFDDQYLWDLVDVEAGNYYLYAVINDQNNSQSVYTSDALTIEPISVLVTTDGTDTTEAGGAVTVSISLLQEPADFVLIPVFVADATEADVSVTGLVFTQQNWQQTQSFEITGVDDDELDGTQEYALEFGAIESSDSIYSGLVLDSLPLFNLDNEIDSDAQLTALTDLYNSTNGDDWSNNTNWLQGSPCDDDWYGVNCNSEGGVVTLNLSNNNLTGILPNTVDGLQSIQNLYLNTNEIIGGLPSEISQLNNLLRLRLQSNLLSGELPPDFGQLNLLIELNLTNNALSGTIPAELAGMEALQNLLLGKNAFSGVIPSELMSLSDLVNLQLHENILSGSLPLEISGLSGLKNLYLNGNNLTGELPASMGDLMLLSRMRLQNNQLIGELPESYGALSQLIEINLSNNDLSGSIPTSWGGLLSLKSLLLGNNQVAGALPAEIGSLSNLESLQVHNNLISGSLPSTFGGMTSLKNMYLNNNQLSGVIPVEMGQLNALLRMRLQNNELTGEIPGSLGSLVSLIELNLSNNQLSGQIPAELGQLSLLQSLLLYSNELDGALPSEIGGLDQLVNLQAHNNQLTGDLPASLGQLVTVKNIYLNGNKMTGVLPTELGGLDAIQRLRLHGNLFTGELPNTLIDLSDSMVSNGLDIRYNRLYTSDEVLDTAIDAMQSGGNWSATQTVAPTDLVISSITPDSITLNWGLIEYQSGPGRYQALISPAGVNDFVISISTGNKKVNSLTIGGLDTTNNSYDFVIRAETDPHNSNTNLLISESSTAVTSDVGVVNSSYAALVALYNETNGEEWGNSENWLSGNPCGNDWYGIDCDSNNQITSIVLSNNNLVGAIPMVLSDLEKLQRLRLNNNQLAGEIPASLGLLIELTELNLSSNQLAGSLPIELSNLSLLQILNLSKNELNGVLPSEISQLSALINLQLNNNLFSGNLPTEISQLNELKNLYLNNNEFTGQVPSALNELVALERLRLNTNLFNGEIPSALGDLSSIKEINLSNNALSGVIPSELTGLTNLQSLILSKNVLSGGLPIEIGDLSLLVTLRVENNLLSGELPSSLAALQALQNLYLNNNEFSGDLPVFLSELVSLKRLRLANNNMTGLIPVEYADLISLIELNLNNNQLSGELPAALGELASLQVLALAKNQISGEVPEEFGNLLQLTGLFLQENNINGQIPAELGQLTQLKNIYLYENQLTGAIPSELSTLDSLLRLRVNNNQLSGLLPPSLSGLTELIEINVSNNQLTGGIPSSWGGMSNLINLLAYNNQFSGQLVPELGNLESLVNLQLHQNEFVGPIPTELSQLQNVKNIYLNKNSFDGGVPPELGSLPVIQRLRLQGNALTGELPPSLTNLSDTMVDNGLDIRYNMLYTNDIVLDEVLNEMQSGGNWSATQTVTPTNFEIEQINIDNVQLTWDVIEYSGGLGKYVVMVSISGENDFSIVGETINKRIANLTVEGLDTQSNDYDFVIMTVSENSSQNNNTLSSENSNLITTVGL